MFNFLFSLKITKNGFEKKNAGHIFFKNFWAFIEYIFLHDVEKNRAKSLVFSHIRLKN